ncbi:hypothetical protein H920_16034 [Fukomys damarensis]|uniref:Uncharacterized protein n=1 Tax=Fukomys damarensis TaxID=885580 RepID=A0A091CT63_FUKDA|nr:hypothetical protein H920_16034 [Fukomys damarensis]
MDRSRLYLPAKVVCGRVGQYRRFQQPTKKTGSFRKRGIESEVSGFALLCGPTVVTKYPTREPNEKVGVAAFPELLVRVDVLEEWIRLMIATIQLDVVEAETEEITGRNMFLRARRTTKRLSVTSLPSGLHKVDDLLETVTDKSMKLLAQRHAELQQCEFLGDEILQCSKQFQRMSKRTMRKYKLKNVCFPCTCCCF